MEVKMIRFCRRTYTRYVLVAVLLLSALCMFLTFYSDLMTTRTSSQGFSIMGGLHKFALGSVFSYKNNSVACQDRLGITTSDVNTIKGYGQLNFKPITQFYWNSNEQFEKKYQQARKNWKKLPLKVCASIFFFILYL